MSSSPSIFNLWFNEFKLASLTDDKAIFTTPSVIKKNILSTKYQALIAESLEEAVRICEESALDGDCCLLSPACASWGMFKNYQQRGDMFKALVLGE